MVDKIDMSLDDIIQSTKKVHVGNGAGPRRFQGNNRNNNQGQRSTGGGFRSSRPSNGVQRGRGRGGISKSTNYTRGDVNSAWKHDMYADAGGRKLSTGGRLGGGAPASLGPTKLMVSNLDFGVSESDIHELFSEFGILKSASVHYDRSGRSLGTADVVFDRRSDALKAMKQYNGVPLDGRAMNIQLATSDIGALRDDRSRMGAAPQRPRPINNRSNGTRGPPPSRGGRQPRRGGPAGGAGGRQKKVTPTAEQLDAELDAYVKEIK